MQALAHVMSSQAEKDVSHGHVSQNQNKTIGY
jgi:hypothetical protein